jgi:hypothetical protein
LARSSSMIQRQHCTIASTRTTHSGHGEGAQRRFWMGVITCGYKTISMRFGHCAKTSQAARVMRFVFASHCVLD